MKKNKNSDHKITVTIKTLVYNHEPYLRQCLDGIVMQNTNFNFEAIVHDDCSTDNSANIIKEYAKNYPDIIKPIYETENQYSKNNGTIGKIIKKATRGKYIAICEGDDYWTDPYKLQKQVNYMESHPNCGLTYGKVHMFNQSEQKIFNNLGKNGEGLKDLIYEDVIPTLTVVYRASLIDEEYKIIRKKTLERKWSMGDYQLWMFLSMKSEIHFIDEFLGVYRILSESASHTTNFDKMAQFIKSEYEVRMLFNEKGRVGLQEWITRTYHRDMYLLAVQHDKPQIAKEHLKKVESNKFKLVTRCIFLYNRFTIKIFKWIKKKLGKTEQIRN